MLGESFYKKADEIIEMHTREERSLISIIQDIQEDYRYLPQELLKYVAKEIGITEAKAYSVASFYENFSFEEKGKYIIKICPMGFRRRNSISSKFIYVPRLDNPTVNPVNVGGGYLAQLHALYVTHSSPQSLLARRKLYCATPSYREAGGDASAATRNPGECCERSAL